MSEDWNPYNGGHRWDHFEDPWNLPTTEHPIGTPGPWSHGDVFNAPPGCTDAEAHMFYDGVNDAIWRDVNQRANQVVQPTQTPADFSPSAQLGDVVDGVSALRSDLQKDEGHLLPPLRPAAEDPRRSLMQQPPARPERPVPSWARRPETYGPAPGTTFWSPADPEPKQEVEYRSDPPRTKGLWMAIGGVSAVVVGAGLINVAANSSESPNNAVQVQAGENGFSCDVNGISEDPATGQAELTFSTSVAGKNIQVFATNKNGDPIGMQNAAPVNGSVTEFSFATSGMHSRTLVIKAGTTVCRGAVTLGTERKGDEQFVNNN